jgi:hypothetical protein
LKSQKKRQKQGKGIIAQKFLQAGKNLYNQEVKGIQSMKNNQRNIKGK